MDGSFAMGVGYALLEEIPQFEDGGADGRWNLNRYHVALARDCAIHDVEKVILPPESPDAPARGIAEVSMCPIAPAVANAVAHATGRRFRSLPITADKVRAAQIALSVGALVVLAVSGWLGGNLSYRYGVRVAREVDQQIGFTAGSAPELATEETPLASE